MKSETNHKTSKNTDGESGQVKRIISNRFFSIYGIKRKTPNEFTQLGDAIEKLKNEIYNVFKISQIVKWLSSKLRRL